MADKNNKSNSGSSKKIPANRRAGSSSQRTGNKSNSSGDRRKSKVSVKEKNSNNKEIIAIVLLTICVFLVVCLSGKAGPLGAVIKDVFCGLFGWFGTIVILLAVVVYGICVLRGNEKNVFVFKRCIVLAGLFLCGSALLHTISGIYKYDTINAKNWIDFISSLWSPANVKLAFLGGGLVGGSISSLLQKAVSIVGTYVILIPTAFIFAMLIFSFSILPFFKKIEGVFKKGWSGITNISTRLKNSTKNKSRSKNTHKKILKKQIIDEDTENYNDDASDLFFAETDADYSADEDNGAVNGDETILSFDEASSGDNNFEGGVVFTEGSLFDKMDENDGNSANEDFESEDLNTEKYNGNDSEESPASEDTENDEDNEVIDFILPENDEITDESEDAEETTEKKHPVEATDMPVLSKGEYDNYTYPTDDLLNLDTSARKSPVAERAAATAVAKKLEDVLRSFSIEAKVTHVSIGPSVTRYELLPSTGVRVNKIKNLSDDIALNLAAQSIRIEAPIPGKAAIGIEVPNTDIRAVYLREIIQSAAFKNNRSNLSFCLGSDISGTPIVADLEKMPHMLIAGTTGSGKSVCTNCLITSLLYKSSPDEVRLILVDPKIVEFSKYNGIPHLLLPVVTEPKKAAAALAWSVSEMEKRYRLFAAHGVRDISSYNTFAENNGFGKMPRIVILIDELADLMMVARDSVETAINRIAQKARAAGMHLVIATQRPSVDVITGLIKSNVPSRIALKVASPVDSRIILDSTGAEKLLGRGDMLFYPVGSMKTTRIQGAFVSDEEIERVVEFIKNNGGDKDAYIDEIIETVNNASLGNDAGAHGQAAGGGDDEDPLFKDAVHIAIQEKQISASYLQRMLKIGYNRAARMVDLMEEKGIVGCRDGSNPRKVLVDHYEGC